MLLDGKTVLIFGGSAGIGAATARLLVDSGARVVALGRDEQRLAALQAELPGVRTLRCDVLSDEDVAAAVAPFDSIDHVVVSAGTIAKGKVVDQDGLGVMRVFQERVGSIVRIVKAAVPRMHAGSFVFTSGIAAVRCLPEAGLMGAALSAVEHLTRALALEIAPIRSNAIRPGLIMTDLVKSYGGNDWEQIVTRTAAALPGKKAGSPRQAAELIRFLLLAEFVNGEILTIDGAGRLI